MTKLFYLNINTKNHPNIVFLTLVRRLFTFGFLCVAILGTRASNLQFYSINELLEVSLRETGSICQDETGFIWTSTKTGALRTTGSDYRIYDLPFSTYDVLSVNMVYSNSTLLACARNGDIFIYDKIYDRFNLLVNLRKEFNSDFLILNQALIDKYGTIWIATSIGLCELKNGEAKIVCDSDIFVRRMALFEETLFYATNDELKTINILSRCKESNLDKINIKIPKTTKLYVDKRSMRLWVGTLSSGLHYYDLKSQSIFQVLSGKIPLQPILAIEQNTDSTLLIGVDGQGIWELDKFGKRVLDTYKENIDNPYSLKGDGVYDIFCDKNNRIWVSTYSHGLSFSNQELPIVNQITHQLNNINSLGNNIVNKIIQDKSGNIWFATNNGISRWRMSSNKWDRFFQNSHDNDKVFLALCEDEDGNIWSGTYSSGAFILDSKTGKAIKHFSATDYADGISDKFIFDIYKDSKGNIWIGGSMGGITCYLAETKQFRTYPCSFDIISFQEYSTEIMLIGSSYGLVMLHTNTGEFENIILQQIIQCTHVMDKHIWFGTRGQGLGCYNTEDKTLKFFTTDHGLTSNYVNSISYKNDYLWLGTERGLTCFDQHNQKVVTHFSDYFLSNISFNSNANSQLNNGNLIWGTNKGAVYFNPNAIHLPKFEGHIFIQDIFVLGQSIRENPAFKLEFPINEMSHIKLRYNQNAVSLELLPISVHTDNYKFSYKMIGVDTDWTTPTNVPIINYTNIPNGKFDIMIRMYNSSLTQIISERSVSIQIIPPFWLTWWFQLLIALVAIGLTLLLLKLYTDKLKQSHNEDKIRFFANMAHDIRTSLTLINAPIDELNKETKLSEQGRYFLNLATDQLGRLSFVTTQLLDFQKVDINKGQIFLINSDIVALVTRRKSIYEPLAEKRGISIRLTTNCPTYVTAIDELKIEKVVDNLLSNAIKYSHRNSAIDVFLTCESHSWTLAVKDNGIGISDNAKGKLFTEFYRANNVVNSRIVGSGIGLILVKNYVAMHNGIVKLESKEQTGTIFTITIPSKNILEGTTDSSLHYTDDPSYRHMEQYNLHLDLNQDSLEQDTGTLSGNSNLNTDKKGHILIVEDHKDLQKFLKTSLQDEYKVTVASDGTEAWEIIQKNTPDLIISDIMMPNMNGLDLCQKVKSTFETAHVPLILLTALSKKTKKLEGLGLGADDYITKPFDMTILKQRIMSIIQNRERIKRKTLTLIHQPTNNEEIIVNNELNDQFLKKAITVVRENMADSEFNKDKFAKAMFASSSLLYKKIKALTGQSPVDFVKTIRLDYSIELLKTNKYTITEVSELCGFSSASYFSTVFKKAFGKSPTEILE